MRLYLTFGTTYGALKAERVLRGAGVGADVVPKPAAIRGACGLAVGVAEAAREQALAALDAAGHRPRQQVILP